MRMHNFRVACILTIILVLGLSWTVSSTEAAEDVCIPMGSFQVIPPKAATAKRASVDFPHSRHFDFSCRSCHHTWDYENPIQNCTTASCHDLVEAPKSSDKDFKKLSIRYFKNAFHQNCIGCHKEIRQANLEAEKKLRLTDKETKMSKTGPISCAGCHPSE
ncbi:MAG: hypothetical protein C4530_16000 [Desulfobacteraceae bacterium]|nr:MAG: hypothetical protein C4530_16000 [Desulfobacteraceae bacterium]